MTDHRPNTLRTSSNPSPDPDGDPERAPRVNPDSVGSLRDEDDFGYDPYAGTGYDGD